MHKTGSYLVDQLWFLGHNDLPAMLAQSEKKRAEDIVKRQAKGAREEEKKAKKRKAAAEADGSGDDSNGDRKVFSVIRPVVLSST